MLRAAIVGLGAWGRTLVGAVQGQSEALRFTTSYTRSGANAAGFCAEAGIAQAASLQAVLDDPQVDAVVLATPNSQHCAQIQAAAQAGKHVFVEKPFTLNAADARNAIAAASRAGIQLAVGFNRRFHPLMRELRARACDGRLGVLASVLADLTATTAFYRAADSWRVNPGEEPAGALAGIGVHLIDAMIDIAGPIREVYCVVDHRASPHGDDTTHLLLKFQSGLTGMAFCSLAAARNSRIAVYGSKGYAELLRPGMDTLRFVPAVEGRASHLAGIPEPEVMEVPAFNSVAAEFDAFARCVRGAQPYPVSLDDVLHGVCVFEAAVQSARHGRPVEVRP